MQLHNFSKKKQVIAKKQREKEQPLEEESAEKEEPELGRSNKKRRFKSTTREQKLWVIAKQHSIEHPNDTLGGGTKRKIRGTQRANAKPPRMIPGFEYKK